MYRLYSINVDKNAHYLKNKFNVARILTKSVAKLKRSELVAPQYSFYSLLLKFNGNYARFKPVGSASKRAFSVLVG